MIALAGHPGTAVSTVTLSAIADGLSKGAGKYFDKILGRNHFTVK
jgi:hypothetical protein